MRVGIMWMAVAACVVALLGSPLSAGAEPGKPFNALVLAGDWFKADAQLEKRLAADGIRLVVRKMSQPISAAQLKLFEVVIVPDFTGLAVPHFVPRKGVIRYLNAKQNIDRLHAYVRDGGGVFFSPLMTGGGQEVAEGCSAVLEPWGARILAAGVRDNAHAGSKGVYAWTTAIGKSPVSAGVRRIWYPTNMLRWDDAYATVPLVLEDKAWTTVVRGMPRSVAAKGLQYRTWLPIAGQTAPAIAAVRQAGRGRVALLSVAPFYTFLRPFAEIKKGWIGESNTGPIEGIFVEKGRGDDTSDGLRLITNMLRWLGEGSRAAGLGGYTEQGFAATPAPPVAKVPGWLSWSEDGGGKPIRVLLGARSTASDGKATVAELAKAAKAAGYSVLVMTETFEHLTRSAWQKVCDAARKASDDELVVMPGIDIADVYQNRFLVFGQRSYPEKFMLSDNGKALKQCQYLSLGFGTHFTAIHRPTTTPIPHQLYKFFAGIVVYTYKGGKLVDDGRLAYQWHVNNTSMPAPLVVHEVRSVEEVAAATAGHQLYIHADTPRNAVWYMRGGMKHFWENPSLFLVSSGPMIKALQSGRVVVTGQDLHPGGEEGRKLAPQGAVVEGDVKVTEVRLINRGYADRIWRPNAKRAELSWHLSPSHLRLGYLFVTDAKGGTAISPPLRRGPGARYTWRCSDRQNFFGWAMNYTGTTLPDIRILLPAFGTDEGRGLWPHPRGPRDGENLCPLLRFPYASPAVYITDATIEQRYWRARWTDVAFDGHASQGTSPSRVYRGRVRYYDFNLSEVYRKKDGRRPMMLKEVSLELRMPVTPSGAVFPAFTRMRRKSSYAFRDPATGKPVTGTLARGFIDLPAGGSIGDLIALSDGLRVGANGAVGFAAPKFANGPTPVGTRWTGRYVRVPDAKDAPAMRAVMGVDGPTPYKLGLTRGKLDALAYMAYLQADRWAVAGSVAPAPAKTMPYTLPLSIRGVNTHWDAAVWRQGGSLVRFGVFEGAGLARLNVEKAGRWFAGNIITADDPTIRLAVIEWDADRIAIEVNNTAASDVETVIRTPGEITGRYRLERKIKVPAGACVRFEFK